MQTITKVSDEILTDIQAPQGWDVVEEMDDRMDGEPINTDLLKENITLHLPFITKRVENYIDRIYNQYNIIVSEAYVSIDADAAFHIVLLVGQKDYLSIEMLAAKVLAKQLLTTTSDVSMRFKFSITEEYFKFHYTQHSYKLRYAFKLPYPLMPDYLGGKLY